MARQEQADAVGTGGNEWLLDNRHVVLRAADQLIEDVPPGFYRVLPRPGDDPDVARIERVATELVKRQEAYVDPPAFAGFVEAFQAVEPLDIGELWALPAFLRLALLERLLSALEPPAPDGGPVVAACISSLRELDQADWKAIVESLSLVERCLREHDPAGAYADMDFASRDRYRKAVEEVARWSGVPETRVVREVVALAAVKGEHVGSLLVGPRREEIEAALGAPLPARVRARRLLSRNAGKGYFGLVGLLTVAAVAAPLWPVLDAGMPIRVAVAALLLVLPAVSVAIAGANVLVTRLVPPRRLAKLDFSAGVPASWRTCVAVPVILRDAEEVEVVLRQLEMNYMGNAGAHLVFALLADPPDADVETRVEDEATLRAAEEGLRRLNQRYGEEGSSPFLLLTRPRRWNPSEDRWMASERKRGKLHELNRLLLGDRSVDLRLRVGQAAALDSVRFVLTLDADTFLPRGAAARLIGTLAHPLNRPRFGPSGRLVAGYTVLQPRVETLTDEGAGATWFTRIFQADRGLDLYSHSVSDVYQDLFAEGIYVGKGLYDVAAFERSLEGRVPENALLSHDLFEGVHGRAALVSDVAVIEDFPDTAGAWMRRHHRWVRGDWQLLPWLLPRVPAADGDRLRSRLSPLARWMLFDNLRRSLVFPALLLVGVIGWLALPGPSWWWAACVVGFPGVPVVLAAVADVPGRVRRWPSAARFHRNSWAALYPLARWAAAVVFLPWQAAVEIDAVARTLVRLVRRRRLLEWTSAAHTGRSLASRSRLGASLAQAAPGAWIGVAVGAALLARPPAGLLAPWALTGGWVVSPLVGWALGRPRRRRLETLNTREVLWLRRAARRTWAYFDWLLTPEDHWLPPDNIQLDPDRGVAHRTSPTNIGLGILSVVSAHDLGHLTLTRAAAVLSNMFETVERLEHHRGHLLNWYNTRNLHALAPRYVSSVDSGNLAACLIATREALHDFEATPLPRPADVAGLADTLEVTAEVVRGTGFDASGLPAEVLEGIAGRLRAVDGDPIRLPGLLEEILGDVLPPLEAATADLFESRPATAAAATIAGVRSWLAALHRHLLHLQEELATLTPWLRIPGRAPAAVTGAAEGSPVHRAWQALLAAVPGPLALAEAPAAVDRVRGRLAALRQAMEAEPVDGPNGSEALAWVEDLQRELDRSRDRIQALRAELASLRVLAGGFVADMDFRFLYDPARGLLRVGYNVDAAALDRSYYDLFASEARLASYVGMAKGDLPVTHWLELGRPFARRDGSTLLLSWAGTMFEYLMPSLFLRTPEGSLGEVACRRAVDAQMAFGRRHRTPWGMSESGFAEVDAHGHYRYRAFGVPDLALRHDTGDDRIVVAPYASALALPVRPASALRNLERIAAGGFLGLLGFLEALDYGPRARPRSRPRPVHSAMAHHQGMIVAAFHHALTDGATSRRFHRDSATASLGYLLHEESPGVVRTSAAPPLAPPTAAVRPAAAPAWRVDPAAFPPESMVLSNGSLSAFITAAGGGGLRWRGRDVLRWRPDPVVQGWGMWIYVRDAASGRVWSAARAPSWVLAERDETLFAGEAVEFHRDHGPLRTRTTVVVSPIADVEIRRVTMVNEGDRPLTLELTSCAEVALAPPAEDRRHPAFARLFVEADFDRPSASLVFGRRAEGLDEDRLFMAHAVTAPEGELLRREVDRGRFFSRGGGLAHPPGVVAPAGDPPPEGPWAPLDPVASLTWRVQIPPGAERTVSFLTSAAGNRRTAVDAIEAHRSTGRIQWAMDRAREEERDRQRELGVDPEELRSFQRLLTGLAFPCHGLRRPSDGPLPEDGGGREALWSIGVSGDVPVLVVRGASSGRGGLLQSLLRAHAYWERRGAVWDLVVLGGPDGGGYAEPLGGWLSDALARTGRSDRLNRPAGIHHVPASRVPSSVARRIEESASVVLDGSHASLAAALQGLQRTPDTLPPFVPVPSAPLGSYPPLSLETGDLELFNGTGGFARDGTAYVLHLEPGSRPPAPWINVVANEGFGFTVSEGGTGFTWDGNSGERRLTPWSNDPVLDPAGEALYLRDEETGEVWSPTPGPAGADAPSRVTHRPGSTTFLRRSHGLEQEVVLYVPGTERVKVTEVTLRNRWPRQRRITLTAFVEWVLGSRPSVTAPHVVTAFDGAGQAILARDRSQPGPVAFLASDRRVHGFTCDRAEFLGPAGRRDLPAGLERIGLAGAVGAGLDPCGALQVHLDLAPGEEGAVRFFLGALDEPEELAGRLATLRDPSSVDRSRKATDAFWEDLLHRTVVRTPARSMDHLLNGWLRYQALTCRLWGRSGFYQSSGAFGFRDQLQDGLGLLDGAPGVCRQRIVDAASRQFQEGDVLHWWHPDTGHGVRTRCSDDRLWLPWVTALYVEATGDEEVLDELVPFLEGAPLAADELERYGAYESSGAPASLHEHCLRALERPDVTSGRGVPLIGSGDWNDGLNRVGVGGRGESFWLGWFLARVSRDYAEVCDRRHEEERARRLRDQAEDLRRANEAHGWDGGWYRRATYDDGTPLGSTESLEGRIDSLPQSWAVLSGAGDPERSRRAMDAVCRELVDVEDRLVLLLKPPFHRTPRHPGYIKSYPPGVRENGGQYTHAAAWVGWALAELGDGDRAEEVFRILNPILRTTRPEEVARYRVEPYVVAGDVYGGAHHRGRGGWTWYTGSASWLYRLGIEAILGLRFLPGGLRVEPCIPRSWKRFVVEHRHGSATYHILVGNPSGVCRGVRSVTLDGRPLEGTIIPLEDDGDHHHVVVVLGEPGAGPEARPSASRGSVNVDTAR